MIKYEVYPTKHPKFVYMAEYNDLLNEFSYAIGVFVWFHHIYQILDVSQFVLNQRGQLLYGIVALESKFDKDNNVIDADYEYITTSAGGESAFKAANIWYQASGKPQSTFAEIRQRMIDEFLGN